MFMTLLRNFAFSTYSVGRLFYWYLEALFRYIVPTPMKSLDGETILVTGAAGGIGSALCRYLVSSSESIKLVMWGTNRKGMEELAKELEKHGARCYVYVVDISSKENIQRAAALVKKDVGPVTTLINNAGVARMGKFLELKDDDIEKTVSVNLMSQIWILRQFLGDMMDSNHGRVVSIGSFLGLSTCHCMLPYVTSKYGMTGYMEALKAELEFFGYDGIKLTTAFPAFTRTPMIKSVELVGEQAPFGMPPSMTNIMEPETVAKAVVDGMRRELEFVYAPQFVAFLPYIDSLLPMKQRRILRNKSLKVISSKDPRAAKILTEGHRKEV